MAREAAAFAQASKYSGGFTGKRRKRAGMNRRAMAGASLITEAGNIEIIRVIVAISASR
jgi:hypothetical protein